MSDGSGNRWDAFSSIELQALDEFFRSFSPMRAHSRDIGKIGREIAAAMERRNIATFVPVELPPAKNRGNSR